jgi:hypothetical protein
LGICGTGFIPTLVLVASRYSTHYSRSILEIRFRVILELLHTGLAIKITLHALMFDRKDL